QKKTEKHKLAIMSVRAGGAPPRTDAAHPDQPAPRPPGPRRDGRRRGGGHAGPGSGGGAPGVDGEGEQERGEVARGAREVDVTEGAGDAEPRALQHVAQHGAEEESGDDHDSDRNLWEP